MASNGERREFEKYLKFLVNKLVQVVVQSRQGQRLKTKSSPNANEWFNISIPDDKQVSVELKRSLEGRLPQPDQPVTLEIQMETQEGDTLVLEVWSVSLSTSGRDVGVSVSHVLYPRLSLMLKSVIALSRTTPTYRLSRQQEDELKFTYRVYTGSPEVPNFDQEFKHVHFSHCSSSYGTVELSLHYRPNPALPDRLVQSSLASITPPHHPTITTTEGTASVSMAEGMIRLPFAPQPGHTTQPRAPLETPPFAGILPLDGLTNRQDSNNSNANDHGSVPSESNGEEHTSLPLENAEHDSGYVLVDLQRIKLPFAEGSATDDVSEFFQQCREVPRLDMFSGDQRMDVESALALIEDHIQENTQNSTQQSL